MIISCETDQKRCIPLHVVNQNHGCMESCLLVSFYSVSTYYTVYEACDSRVFTFLVSAFCIPQYRAGTVLYFKSARVRRVYSIHVLWQGDIEHERHIGTYGFTFTSTTLESRAHRARHPCPHRARLRRPSLRHPSPPASQQDHRLSGRMHRSCPSCPSSDS